MNPKNTIIKLEANLHAMEYPMSVENEVQGAHVRFTDFVIKIPIRDFRIKHLHKMVSFEGIVRRVTSVRPKLQKALYLCEFCSYKQTVDQKDNVRKEPMICSNPVCRKKGGLHLLEEESTFLDYQMIQVQEPPESVRTSYNTQSIDVLLEDDLTGTVNPGERVIINGILEAVAKENSKGTKSVHYNKRVRCHSIEHIDKDFEEIEISATEEQEILNLGKDPEVYDKLLRSISPTIYNVGIIADVKFALLLQLFSGVPKRMKDHSRIRGDIHILLVGDPGVAKSQLLRNMVELAPRGIYTTGKGSTASGLTATVVRDDLGEGRWILEGGTLVMANHGLATIDEMDKMKEEDRGALHEAMEQQTISISKAGIVATLKSECSVLGACNPKDGKYDPLKPLSDQVGMPNTLLSRFDIIFVILDHMNEENDILVAEHILDNHELGEELEEGEESTQEDIPENEPLLDQEFVRKYVAYARLHIRPKLTPEAREKIAQFYTSVRKMRGEGTNTPIPITARQLEALIRLSEACAKARLSKTIEEKDVLRVIHIMRVSLKQVGMDPVTGQMMIPDIQHRVMISENAKIKKIIERECQEHGSFTVDEIINLLKVQGIKEERVKHYVENILFLRGYLKMNSDSSYSLLKPIDTIL